MNDKDRTGSEKSVDKEDTHLVSSPEYGKTLTVLLQTFYSRADNSIAQYIKAAFNLCKAAG